MTLRIYCPFCSAEIRNDSGICSACGVTIGSSREDDATQRFDFDKSPRTKPTSYDSIDDARFIPGKILVERYRVVGLLGKGGMGEVYRADDLKLGQPVALKFLPDHLHTNGAALARFHREVRVARQVSHKNVCRVYDIGETDGRHFLSMEYIKGEELSSLLRRIGRLPVDKSIQLARQICAGLNAAHEAGVLHRDLKPANVMIDAEGNARILDFGLAGLGEEFGEDELGAGTPAYMAPEQLQGDPVSVRSDIYSLGLLLYELFTNRKAFDAPTLGDLIKLRRSNTTPTTPSSIVKDIDPVIEGVIDRCLQKDPSLRPASALQVAAALPGGDPIAAALAAGETPSPEMVAAAPKKGTLRPAVAAALLLSIVLLLGVAMVLSQSVAVHNIIPLKKSPELLKEQATQLTKSLGYTSEPADTASGFDVDSEYYDYLSDNHSSVDAWKTLKSAQPPLVYFWYRQSPGVLVPFSQQWLTFWDPPTVPGMVQLRLDTDGKLNYFEAVPEQVSSFEPPSVIKNQVPSPQPSSGFGHPESGTGDANLEALFSAAGLDISQFQPADSQWTPPNAYDTRRAWVGVYPNLSNTPLRIETASFRNRPVYFAIISPWNKPASALTQLRSAGEKTFIWILFGIFFGILLLGALLALRNLRLRRGDRRGAFRVALFVFVARMSHWVFTTHHVADNAELLMLITGIQSSLFWSGFIGVMYLALEPYLRRHWPERTISWNRLLTGDFRDPLIGRDVLIGAAIGAFIGVMRNLSLVLPRWLTSHRGVPFLNSGYDIGISGANAFAQMFFNQLTASMVQTFMIVFLVLFLCLLLRKEWLGITVGWLILCALFIAPEYSSSHWTGFVVTGIVVGAFIFCAVRFGPVALTSTLIMVHLWVFYPITTELTAWYATSFIMGLAVLLALAIYSFRMSLGGQKLFKGNLLKGD